MCHKNLDIRAKPNIMPVAHMLLHRMFFNRSFALVVFLKKIPPDRGSTAFINAFWIVNNLSHILFLVIF